MDNETNEIGGRLIEVEINKEFRKSYLDYSMSVITARVLPDVRDGLKPVQRRILYTMYQNTLYPDKPYRKCADTIGTVLGRYHPHGDQSVYDAMVRLAQTFSLRYMLVDGHGNFGSIDGDPPAAYRYTESRMSKLSMEMLDDIEKETVDFMPNYDDRLKEPVVLPSKFPNLLVNGTMGIAVGMATNIPPHNMREVIDGMCHLIDNPEAEISELMEFIEGPDFPTRGIIMGRSGIRSAYQTGRGKIILRARAEIVEGKNGRFQIVVSELPYKVNKAELIISIAELVKDKRIEGISDVNDYSNRQGMNMVIDLKRDANPQLVLNQLYSYSQLQITVGVNSIALVRGEPKLLNLKQMLQYYIDHQCDVITRRTQFELNKAQERAHIVEALLKALDYIDEIIAILRASKNIPEGKEALMERYGFDDIQATHIVGMRLGQLTGLEREKLEDEIEELRLKIAEYLEILGSHERILAIIKHDALVIRDKYADERRTVIENISGEVDDESLIEEETCVFTMTTLGYIKRQPVDTFAQQKRGGRGVLGMTRREEDVAETMFTCSTHDFVLFFTTKGRMYRLKGYEIPEGSRTSKGMNIVNLLPIEQDEKISAMLSAPREANGEFLCMVTKNGVIKRTELDAFKNVRKSGIIAINLDEGDELIWVRLTNGENNLLVGTKKGMSICFNELEARAVGRAARGVRSIKLRQGDEVVGLAVLDDSENKTVLTVSETGYGRRSEFGDYRIQSRGGIGTKNYRTNLYGDVADIRVVDNEDDIILISSDGIIIRIPASQISIFARPSKGVRVMRVSEGERLLTIAATPAEEDAQTDSVIIEDDNGEGNTTEVAEEENTVEE